MPARRWDWKPIPFTITDAKNRQALFIAPFVLDPNEPNRILGGGVSLWRTNDAKTANTPARGPSWAAIKPSAGPPISAIAIAKGNSDVVWVGHTDGQIYKTVNGTTGSPVWQRMDHTGPSPLTPQRYCTGITIDPRDSKVVYVTFGGYVRGNVWKTTDAGLTWANIGAGLPEAPVRALAVHPRKAGFLYLGAEVGVFASEDAGAVWSPTNEGPTNCSVDDLFWLKETLVCVTHGRGMFKIDLSGVVRSPRAVRACCQVLRDGREARALGRRCMRRVSVVHLAVRARDGDGAMRIRYGCVGAPGHAPRSVSQRGAHVVSDLCGLGII